MKNKIESVILKKKKKVIRERYSSEKNVRK